jgi:hypothetical protein
MIQPKIKSVIKSGINYHYDQASFATHKVPNFYETDNPQVIIDEVKPMEMFGKRLLFVDTETYAEALSNHAIPNSIVRRWVGSGKKASPQDFPFCMTICNGTVSYALYDTLDNGFRKFKALAPILHDRTIDKVFHNAN